MLHKSKSKKVNVWKYSLILPILALFLMSFSTKEILVVKESPEPIGQIPQVEASQQLNSVYDALESNATTETKAEVIAPKRTSTANVTSMEQAVASNVKGDISITIVDMNTTDAELDKISADLKKEGLTVKFKGVKRNSSGEITSLKVEAKSKNSNANFNVSSDKGIKPVKIIYDTENESISIGNGHSKHDKHTIVYETGGVHKVHTSGNDSNVFVITEAHGDVVHEEDSRIVVRKNGKNAKVKTIRKSKNVEVISGDDDVVEIIVEEDGDRDNDVIIVNGKNVSIDEGTAEIIVKENGKNVWISDDGDDKDVIVIENKDSDNNIYVSGFDGDPLYIIDGKEVNKETFSAIDADTIDTMTVLKDESAMKKYGDKGKNGVIIIKTKK